jgi:hypothetical protein
VWPGSGQRRLVVVDLLEVVDVEVQDRDHAAVPVADPERVSYRTAGRPRARER